MNQLVKPPSQGDVIDILLADLAIRVQLSPSNYSLAVYRGNVLSDGSIGQIAPCTGVSC